ncbi:MAG: hypothetical protein AAF616_13305 [Bacteroidota bacterium]
MIQKTKFTVLLLLISSSLFAGGGWTKAKGKGFFKLSQYAIIANQYFASDGSIVRLNRGTAFYSTALYSEYGLSDRLTTEIFFPFFTRATLDKSQLQNGTVDNVEIVSTLGDTNVSFKYGIKQKGSTVISAKITFGLPLGDPAGGRSEILQTGDGEFNQMISMDVGHSFYPAPFYANATLGFNNRTKGFSEEIRYGLEAGMTLKRLTIIGRLVGIKSLMNGNASESEALGLFANNLEFLSFMPEVIYKVKENFGITAAIGTAFSGKRVLANPSYELGLFLEI